MAFETDPGNPDLAALVSRRDDVRAFAEEMADFVMALPMPETFVEAARAVTVSDRFLQRVPATDAPRTAPETGVSPVKDHHRLRLRACGDDLLTAARHIDKPACFLEGERAMRFAFSADRMLIQLYTPQRSMKAGSKASGDDDSYSEGDDTRTEFWRTLLDNKLIDLSRKSAESRGYWPDGSPFDPARPDYWQTTPREVVEATAAANRAAGRPVLLAEDQDEDIDALIQYIETMDGQRPPIPT